MLYLSCEKNENKRKVSGFGPFLKKENEAGHGPFEKLVRIVYLLIRQHHLPKSLICAPVDV